MLRRLMLVPIAALGVATAFLVTGAGSAVTSAELVSAGAGGFEASAASGGASVSGDGRYVAFHSSATNLPGVDGNGFGQDVFVRDRTLGVTERLTGGNGSSSFPSISDDGRWVAFRTTRFPSTTVFDVFLYDRDTDSVAQIAPTADGSSYDVAVSGDGNFVAFTSTATNLVVGGSDSAPDVYRWTRADGTIEKMSVNSDEFPGAGGGSFEPAISDDGNLVAFASDAVNLIPFPGDANNETDIYLRDVAAGTTEAVSVDNAGALPPSSPFTFGAGLPAISGDGRYVAFDSWSAGLTGATSGLNVYLRDRTLGTTIRVSTGNGTSGGTGPVAISDNPHVLFQSGQQLVAGGNTAFRPNIYRYAVGAGTLERVSVTPACVNGTSASTSLGARDVAVSDDGSTAVYANEFTNIVPTATIFPNIVAASLITVTCTATGSSDISIPPLSTSGSTSTGTTSAGTTTTSPTSTTSTPPTSAPAGVADLHVRKSASRSGRSDGYFAPGEPIVFTVEIENEGDLEADSVHLLDAITWKPIVSETLQPPGSIDISVTGCEVSGTSIECWLPTIVPGGKVTVTYTVAVGHRYRDTFRLDNDARVTTTSPESDLSDNRVSAYANVSGSFDLTTTSGTGSEPFVDLVVTKQIVSEPAFGEKFAPNEPIEYVVEIANIGTADAHQVELNDHVHDPYDRSSSFVANADAIVPGPVDPPDCVWNASAGGVGGIGRSSAGIRLKCDDLGTIPAGGSIEVRYSATAVLGSNAFFATGSGMILRNFASAYAVERDRNNEDNDALLDQPLDPALVKCTASKCPSGTKRDDHFVGPTRTRVTGPTMTRPPPLKGLEGNNTYTNIGEGWTVFDGGGNGVLTGTAAIFHAGNGHDRASCNGCRAFMWNGNDAYVGGPLRDVVFLGPGSDKAETRGGRDFVFARDGQKDAVDCGAGAGDVVVVDSGDTTKGCETVIGADVNGNLRVSSRGERVQEQLFWVVNFGPAIATNVEVRLEVTIREASLLRHRLFAEGVRCSVEESPGRDADRIVVTCTIPSLPPGKQKTMVLRTTTNRPGAQLHTTVHTGAAEPDHRPTNNDKVVAGFSPE